MDPNDNREQVSDNEKARGIPKNIIDGLGIVITVRHEVVGSNGGYHWFQLREKYCFTGLVRKIITCDECAGNMRQRMHTFYSVDIDGETFLVDKDFCVEYNQPIDNTVANKGRYEDWLEPGIIYPEDNDYVKQTEKITGMKNKTTPDYADDQFNDSLYNTKFKTVDKSAADKKEDEDI